MNQEKVDPRTISELERWLDSQAHSLVVKHVQQRISDQFLTTPLGDVDHLVLLRQLAQTVELYEESLRAIVRSAQLSERELARIVNINQRKEGSR